MHYKDFNSIGTFIELHLFAGFSGGRKSILPGVVSGKTIQANHCSEFIAHEKAWAGILKGNPIHIDMLFAAKKAKLAFIINVVIGYGFSVFLEGICGFGSPVAILARFWLV